MRTYKKKPGLVYKIDLAMLLHELFDEPIDRVTRSPKWGMELVKTIFKVITDALHRGEDVKINGFGTFYVKKPKDMLIRNLALKTGGKLEGLSPVPILVKRKKKVYFRPSYQLRAMLNGGINFKERRAMETW